MNGYVLLRNNKQEGPYSFEELVNKNLQNSDLVLKEGSNFQWLHPYEFEELKPYIDGDNTDKDITERKIRLHKTAIHILGLMAAVLSGLLIVSALSMINLVDHKKQPGKHGYSLTATTNSTPALPEGSVPDHPTNKHIQNALVTELVTADTKDEHKRKIIDNLKKQVTISGNDNTLGKKGGIRNLYLTIENRSFILLKNVKVQVDYFNSVGNLINSEIITIKNVPARGEKSWRMVDSEKGVQVQYKILDIFLKKQRKILFEA